MEDASKKSHLAAMEEAFTTENPYAAEAVEALRKANAQDYGTIREQSWLHVASTNATLALAYEQRQTRFDLETAVRDHAQSVTP